MESAVLNFADYLLQKKINADRFKEAEPERYAEWERLFAQLNADSFTGQKKFLINNIRRKYIIS